MVILLNQVSIIYLWMETVQKQFCYSRGKEEKHNQKVQRHSHHASRWWGCFFVYLLNVFQEGIDSNNSLCELQRKKRQTRTPHSPSDTFEKKISQSTGARCKHVLAVASSHFFFLCVTGVKWAFKSRLFPFASFTSVRINPFTSPIFQEAAANLAPSQAYRLYNSVGILFTVACRKLGMVQW